MGYCGCKSIEELRSNARFCRVSGATVVENHPHDIMITKESSNYMVGRAGEQYVRCLGMSSFSSCTTDLMNYLWMKKTYQTVSANFINCRPTASKLPIKFDRLKIFN
jgi:hypothetical protein